MSDWTSNALNFDSFCSGGVDQRTRSYSYQILLGSLIGNWLKGPNLDIGLQFSSYSTENLGFGKGWALNIPRYNITEKKCILRMDNPTERNYYQTTRSTSATKNSSISL